MYMYLTRTCIYLYLYHLYLYYLYRYFSLRERRWAAAIAVDKESHWPAEPLRVLPSLTALVLVLVVVVVSPP